MSKVRIPKNHFDFYRQVYNYLHHSLDVETEHVQNLELSQQMIGNYLHKHQLKKTEENLIIDNNQSIEKDTDDRQSELLKLHNKISQCHDCFLGALRKKPVTLPPFSPIPIMVLVDMPSFYDQTQGRYFTDEAGNLLKKILKSINLDLNKIYYTALIKCVSVKEISDQLSNVTPCKNHLLNEIRLLAPKLIIGFGKTSHDLLVFSKEEISHKNLLDDNTFEKNRGKVLDFNGIEVVFTHHPKDLIHDPSLKKEVWDDLKNYKEKISQLLQGTP